MTSFVNAPLGLPNFAMPPLNSDVFSFKKITSEIFEIQFVKINLSREEKD